MTTFKAFPLEKLFKVKSGDFHALKELDPGEVPLVSCGDTNNGVVGYFDIADRYIYGETITVAYNGSWPLMAKFHPYRFGAKDDVAVLVPRMDIGQEMNVFVAMMLNRMTWRYSYGRKCFRQKLESVPLFLPVVEDDSDVLDERFVKHCHAQAVASVLQRVEQSVEKWELK